MTRKNDGAISMNASAAVTVSANKSQSLIVILAVTMAIVCVIGCILVYVYNPLYWVLFAVAGVLLIACIILAVLTHRNTDLAGAHATVIEAGGAAGVKIVVDPRVDIASQKFVPLLTVLSNMTTLPEPSGFVDKNLNPIQNTEQEAMQKVASINSEAQLACSEAIANIVSLPTSEPMSGPVISMAKSEQDGLLTQEYINIAKGDIEDL
ncbi:hypothetical protein [Klebsiella aerogenes]|uniref:hypothetical protein n=1 Tax=Klebsiella aerogenes TaxID=548 RepID=UPI00215081AA|nr:hypothetical protein [Klebsiella aerogenes]